MLIIVISCVLLLCIQPLMLVEGQNIEQPAPAAASAPIYVSFTRWENRTFSPRVYYYILVNQRPSSSDNQTATLLSPSVVNSNKLGSSSGSTSSTRTPLTQQTHDNDDEEELTPNHLDDANVFTTRLNTPRPGGAKGKNRIKQTSIQFPGFSDRGGDDTKPPQSFPEPLQLQQPSYGTRVAAADTGAPPPDENLFAFPTTSLVLSNVTATDKRKGTENETLEKGTGAAAGVGFYIKQQHQHQQHQRDELQGELSTRRTPPPSQPPRTPADDIEIDSYGLTFDIFRVSKQDWKSSNVLFSPFSFLNIMAVLLLGANGTTFNELTRRLRPRDPGAIVRDEFAFHLSFQRLLQFLNTGSGTNVALDIFNGLFVDTTFPLRPAFRQAALDLYSAQTSSFDFGRDREAFKDKVNKLVAFKTHDKIRTVLDDPVDPSTTLALINTIYFRGSWEKPFLTAITKKRSFYVNANDTVPIDMMTNVLTVPYLETPNYRVVGLPYKGNKTGFFILLPTRHGIEGLQEMEARLTAQDFDGLFTFMRATQVTLQLPKMRVEGADSEAKTLMKRLGLGSLFDPRTADLSRVSNTNGLYIKSIVHKAILDLDESGTEAAAASVATGDRTFDDDPPVQFIVNRPFTFCILHVQAKTVLFMGRVTRPVPLPAAAATNTSTESKHTRART